MSVVDMARRIKVVHPDYLIMYKLGTFYKAFGKDAYILSSIFGYKYSIIDENIPICGFPIKTLEFGTVLFSKNSWKREPSQIPI